MYIKVLTQNRSKKDRLWSTCRALNIASRLELQRRLNSAHLDRAGAKNRAVYSKIKGQKEKSREKNEWWRQRFLYETAKKQSVECRMVVVETWPREELADNEALYLPARKSKKHSTNCELFRYFIRWQLSSKFRAVWNSRELVEWRKKAAFVEKGGMSPRDCGPRPTPLHKCGVHNEIKDRRGFLYIRLHTPPDRWKLLT